MNELQAVLENPQALITLGVLLLAIMLFISGALAPESVSYTHLTLPTICSV